MVHYSVVPTTIPPTWEHTKALIGPYVGTGPVLTVERLEYQRTHAHTTHSLFRAVARPPLLPADYYSAVRISTAASAFSNFLTASSYVALQNQTLKVDRKSNSIGGNLEE